ncbi:MAG: selenium cofactor biosynthesis protein YqeC [Geminicoccaceae bacterium]
MDRNTAEAFIDALGAASGLVAVVGAGGKKSTLYRLLEAHRAIGTRRVLLTSTVQIAAQPNALDVETHIIDGDDVEDAIAGASGRAGAFFVTGPARKPGRFSGLPEHLIRPLHTGAAFGVGLVKADGARMRMIKAPGGNEPALPDGVSTILPIVSARAFGRPLTERMVHRPECLASVINADIGTEITPDHVARLLASPEGSLRRTGNSQVVPVINMVDSPERQTWAEEAAERALSMTKRFERVVLTSMTNPSPLVKVITG